MVTKSYIPLQQSDDGSDAIASSNSGAENHNNSLPISISTTGTSLSENTTSKPSSVGQKRYSSPMMRPSKKSSSQRFIDISSKDVEEEQWTALEELKAYMEKRNHLKGESNAGTHQNGLPKQIFESTELDFFSNADNADALDGGAQQSLPNVFHQNDSNGGTKKHSPTFAYTFDNYWSKENSVSSTNTMTTIHQNGSTQLPTKPPPALDSLETSRALKSDSSATIVYLESAIAAGPNRLSDSASSTLLLRPFQPTKMSYFTDFTTSSSTAEYCQYLRTKCNNDTATLEGMIITTVAWHTDRCNGNISLLELVRGFHRVASPIFGGISSPDKMRLKYYNDFTRGKTQLSIPASPPLHLPPGVLAVNIHQSGAAGQCCKLGREICNSFGNGSPPTFTKITVSIGSGSVDQYAPICDSCFDAHYGFDPALTFVDKNNFDSEMNAHAARNGFRLTKETGPKTDIGGVKIPKYLGVACSKKSPNRPENCNCRFLVRAILVENADGGYHYRYNNIQLDHDHATLLGVESVSQDEQIHMSSSEPISVKAQPAQLSRQSNASKVSSPASSFANPSPGLKEGAAIMANLKSVTAASLTPRKTPVSASNSLDFVAFPFTAENGPCIGQALKSLASSASQPEKSANKPPFKSIENNNVEVNSSPPQKKASSPSVSGSDYKATDNEDMSATEELLSSSGEAALKSNDDLPLKSDGTSMVDIPASLSLQLASPPTAEKTAYFMSLSTKVSNSEYLRYLRTVCDDKASTLVQMIVATAAWHLNRCDGNMNLLEFLQHFLQCGLAKQFAGIMTPNQMRLLYYNNYTRGKERLTIPASPPLHLPPGVLAVNIHQIGDVGQSCKFGEKKCVSFKNGTQPAFTEVAVSISSGSVLQKAPICNSCFNEHFSFDPALTFTDKNHFDSVMKAHASKKGFKLTKETGPKTEVGGVKVPKYFGVNCSKKSANRSEDCKCGFKVVATLVQKNGGGHYYRMNTMQLEHSHKMASTLSK